MGGGGGVVGDGRIGVGGVFFFIAVFSEMPVKRCGESAGTGLRSRPPYLMSVHVGRRGRGGRHHGRHSS